jgi:hypothetical protein
MTSPTAEIRYRLSRPRVLATWVFDRLFDRVFDKRHGIRTSTRVSLSSLNLDAPDRAGYQPVSYLDFPVMMRAIEPSGTFVDFGSGAGRCVYLASRYPFSRVIGVELSDVLCSAARRNIGVADSGVQIECADATAFAIPPDATIFAFNNPFRGEILRAVLQNIASSVKQYPRQVTLLAYGSPVDCEFFDVFRKAERFRIVRQIELPTGCIGMVIANAQSVA